MVESLLLIFSRYQSFFSLLAETESSVQNSGCDLAEPKLELGEVHGFIRPTETFIAIFLFRLRSYLDPSRYDLNKHHKRETFIASY